MNSHPPSDQVRLELLQKSDPLRPWRSLDDHRLCMGCGRTLTGRAIRISRRGPRVYFECPTPGCVAGLAEFAAPGDPFLDDDVWHDWERTISAAAAADESEDLTDVAPQAGCN